MLSAQRIIFSVLLIAQVAGVSAQTKQISNIDSLKQVLATDLNDTSRIWVLNNLGRNFQNSDTVLILAEQAIALSRSVGFPKGEAEAYSTIGHWFNQKGNYPRALESYHRAIQLAESINYEAGLKRSFNSISTVYLYIKDYRTAIRYARVAQSMSIKQQDLLTLALSSSWLSKGYFQLQQEDSALVYAQQSYEAAVRSKEAFALYVATARLGEVHSAYGNAPLALEYLRLSLHYSRQDGRFFRIAGAHTDLANQFAKLQISDSSRWHANEAFRMSKTNGLTASLLASSLLLSRLYEGKNDSESLRYHKIALAAQDSLFSQDKNQQVEALRYSEIGRQKEIETLKLKAAEERKNNLQYAAIALGLVVFIIVFLLFSHSVLAKPRFIKFLGVLALLIIFEFINLFTGPFVDTITGHSPLLMLLIMVCVAAILIPLHSRLERLITDKLIAKNNKIRLVAAKKVIAALEPEEEK